MYTSAIQRRFHRSHSKRDRHFVFQTDNPQSPKAPETVRENPPTTFLFLPYSIVKKPTQRLNYKTNVKNPRRPTVKPASISMRQLLCDFFRISPERRTSSPAAPPPSSVRRVIEATPFPSQHNTSQKIQKKRKPLLWKMFFDFPHRAAGFDGETAGLTRAPAARRPAPCRRLVHRRRNMR